MKNMKKKSFLMLVCILAILFSQCFVATLARPDFEIPTRVMWQRVKVIKTSSMGDFCGRLICSLWAVLVIYSCVNHYFSKEQQKKILKKTFEIITIITILLVLMHCLGGAHIINGWSELMELGNEDSENIFFKERITGWIFGNGVFISLMVVIAGTLTLFHIFHMNLTKENIKLLLWIFLITIITFLLCYCINGLEFNYHVFLEQPICQHKV